MRKAVLLGVFLSLFLLTGCDMFRRMAGRPTSDELQLRKMEIDKREKEIELMKLEQARIADSLAILDSVRNLCGNVLDMSELGGVYTTDLTSRYYIVVGAFKRQSNAMMLVEKATNSGYLPVFISFKNGLSAVAVSPTDKLTDALLSLKAVKCEDFCPEDVWILVNN